MSSPSTRHPSLAIILEVTADEFGVSVPDLRSVKKCRKIARPRQVVMYLARHLTLLSLPAIGRDLGDRDHTTVMHGIDKVADLMDGDPTLRARVHLLKDALAQTHIHAVPA